MEAVTEHSAERATEEAVRLWSFSSAQYPIEDGAVIQARLEYMIVESASAFSFNARRAMEVLHPGQEFKLRQPRYEWKPTVEGRVVGNLWDALNRIIHSRKMRIGFVQLPAHLTVITGGAYVVPYLQADTDKRRNLAFVDIFALSHCFLYDALPVVLSSREKADTVH